MAEKDRMRTKQFLLHLTEDEMRIGKEKAKLAGLNMSEYLRKQIVDGFVISLVNRELVLRMAEEFNAIGININQIAKIVNTNKNVSFEEIERIHEQIAEMQSIVMRYLYEGVY